MNLLRLFIVLLLGMSTAAISAEERGGQGTITRVAYHGICATDPDGRIGLRNPERGLRIETLVAEAVGADAWGPAAHLRQRVPSGFHPNHWVRDMERFAPDGLTLAQMYCYLTEYADKPISEEKLALLQQTFDLLREHGFKAVLRFAYEKTNDAPKDGPTKEWILNHIEQLKPIIAANEDVIYVLQAGFIGAWGEWHSATHIAADDLVTRAEILGKLLELLPPDRMTQVRVPWYKHKLIPYITGKPCSTLTAETAFSGIPEARIGFHNDGILAGPSHGGTWPEAPLFGKPGNPEFDRVTLESAWTPTDGELFWSDQGCEGTETQNKGVDGFAAINYLRLHRFSSFSIAHSYSEREGQLYAIDFWRKAPASRERLLEEHLPVSDGWLEDAYGEPVERTQFEYIRDHLGYRFELQWADIPQTAQAGKPMDVAFEIVNRGFSTLFNPRTVYIVLIPQDEEEVYEFSLDVDPRCWQPYAPEDTTYAPLHHTVSGTFQLPETVPPGVYAIGVWLPDSKESIRLDPRYAIRLANRDTAWWENLHGQYGVNVLYTIRVLP